MAETLPLRRASSVSAWFAAPLVQPEHAPVVEHDRPRVYIAPLGSHADERILCASLEAAGLRPPVWVASRRFRAETTDVAGENAMIAAADEAGTRVQPEYGSLWLRMDGPDAASALLHATVAVPGATSGSTGLPENRLAGGVWIMDAGTSAAHIMIPGR